VSPGNVRCTKLSNKVSIHLRLFGKKERAKLIFFLPWPGGVRPEGGGAASGEFAVAAVALHPGPQAAIGKAVMGFGVKETLGQLTLGDVGDEADMGSGGLQVLVQVSFRS
jgi:hypothetical protein